MRRAPVPEDESTRLDTLHQYQILYSEPEAAFDDLTSLAASICATPIAIVSLMDADCQWFKSKVGVETVTIERDISFCSHTILQPDILIVPDALADERFADNPLVIHEPGVRFYAGVPLTSLEGHQLGALCVVDRVPRELSQNQIDALRAIGRQVVAQLELRRRLIESERFTRELQHNEAALRESEERFRTMANNSPALIWIDDSNQQAVFCNQTGLQFMGLSPSEITGQSWQQCLHPDDIQRWSEAYNVAFETRSSYTTEYRLRRADGEYRWMLEIGVPRFLADGIFAGFVVSCVDITERRTLEESRRMLQTVTQAIVASSDFHSALQVAVEKVCEATQWEFGEAWVPSSDKTVMECSPAWFSKIARLKAFRQQSTTFTFPPGVGIPGRVWGSKRTEWHQDISLETSATYLRSDLALAAGLKATLGIPLLAGDEVITVLVFYMCEARQADQRLIDLIAASTELGLFIQRKQTEEEIRKSLVREQELNQFKSNFIASLSHELRTPLTSVLGLSKVLLKQHFGSINSKQEQYLSVIHSSGDHLLKLINDLLDLAKIEAGKQEVHKERVDVEHLCRNAMQVVEVRAIAKQQTLSLQLPVAVESIVADQQRIFQILLNYLSNAVKFTPERGRITVSSRIALGLELDAIALPLESANLSKPSQPEAQFLGLEVSDTGIGISLENQHLLFQSFQQIESVGEDYLGTGLGLTLAKQFAELHGGRVSFSSSAATGSTFSVWLPL